ncbi:MAG: two-component system response regulator [Desulfamplus sp.]|nr:two-component system response regulator [Desulfamplus sp.]
MVDISNFTVMVVDDTEANIDVLVNTLEDMYDIQVAMDGETALEDIKEEPPDLILLDIMMPGMDGYEVCQRLKADESTKNIPVIFLTAMTDEKDEAKGLALGAVDYVTKPFSPDLVKARVKNQLELKKHRDHLEELVQERTKELALTQEVTIYSLASLAETRDPETGGHIMRTQRYVKILAEQLKNHPKFQDFMDDRTIELLYQSAPLHDIGKVGVPDSILMKPGKLTEDEFAEMKKHTIRGRDALRVAELKLGSNSFMHYAREIAYTHQEKWDGSGYPDGIKGEEIPISGRLMAIADVYDALVSKRFYKPPFSHKKALEIIKDGKGKHFDPDMVDAFVAIENEVRMIAIELADSEEEKAALTSE